MKKAATQPLPDEAAHIARAKAGDKDAYRYLVEGYQDRLFGLIVSMVSKPQEAEDLVQEVFVKAYFALPSFQGQSAFYTWLFRIATNHCLDFRRKRSLPQVSLDVPVDAEMEIDRLQTLRAPAAEQPEAPLEVKSDMAALLETLPADQRLIISLRELEGFSYEEIARITRSGLNTVKSRLNRAREALKAAYVKKFGNITVNKPVQELEEERP